MYADDKMIESLETALAALCPQFDSQFRSDAVRGWIGLEFDSTYWIAHPMDEVALHLQGFILSEIQHSDPSKGIGVSWTGRDCYFASSNKHPTNGGALFICNVNNRKIMLQKTEEYVAKYEELMGEYAVSIRSYTSMSEKLPADESVIVFTVKFDRFAQSHPPVSPTLAGKLEFNAACGEGTTVELAKLTSERFMQIRSEGAKRRYQALLEKATQTIYPASLVTELDLDSAHGKEPSKVHALHIAFSADRPKYLFTLNRLIENMGPGVSIVKQFFETFANGVQVYGLYVRGSSPEALESAASSLHMLPSRPGQPIMELYHDGLIDPQQAIFAFSAVIFAYYFTPPVADDDTHELRRALRNDPVQLKRFNQVYNRLFQELMKEKHVGMVIRENLALFKEIYELFLASDLEVASTKTAATVAALLTKIDKSYLPHDKPQAMLWRTFVTFVTHIRATNFFKAQRAAVAYRLDPSFLGELGVPRIPHAVYMVLGSTFRGFHIRFHDISRGGIRMIIPRSRQEYNDNKKPTLFQENYNLAYTQMLKNKDIPESGAKGTILLSPRYDSKTWSKKTLFLQYVSSLLDIMKHTAVSSPAKSLHVNHPHILSGVRSSLTEPEILFLGPDENTAGDFPSTAAHFAREQGYNQWKVLTTGKQAQDGGIPHDTYGMTTTSVRAYVEGIYEKLGLDETKLTKFQTGGPDGDLGSNEILMGKETWKGICDGSGCLFDPQGLDGDELKRLARRRLPISHYNPDLISKEGAFVAVNAENVTLPDGTLVESGSRFLSEFHFTSYVRADVFVPCGGRPNSVTLQTVGKLIDMKGVTGVQLLEGSVTVPPSALHFKYIVEGANLFISPDARLALENAGVILIKDASANKGGVTSSSVEVFVGLALNDDQFLQMMCCKKASSGEIIPSPFYNKVTSDIIMKIKSNARKEFDAIWNDTAAGHGDCDGHRTIITDLLSKKIVEIAEFVGQSKLLHDAKMFRYVIYSYCPPTLLEEVPLDVLLSRVPASYLRAIFVKTLASDYVYTYGVTANEFSFFEYMNDLQQKAAAFALSHPVTSQ